MRHATQPAFSDAGVPSPTREHSLEDHRARPETAEAEVEALAKKVFLITIGYAVVFVLAAILVTS
jgi:hypothetical protein